MIFLFSFTEYGKATQIQSISHGVSSKNSLCLTQWGWRTGGGGGGISGPHHWVSFRRILGCTDGNKFDQTKPDTFGRLGPVQLGGEPCQATSSLSRITQREESGISLWWPSAFMISRFPALSFLFSQPRLRGVTASCAPPPPPPPRAPPNTHKKQRRPQHMHVLVCDYQVYRTRRTRFFTFMLNIVMTDSCRSRKYQCVAGRGDGGGGGGGQRGG